MFDLIILGNGMAGMTAALYARRANLDFKIVGITINVFCVSGIPFS